MAFNKDINTIFDRYVNNILQEQEKLPISKETQKWIDDAPTPFIKNMREWGVKIHGDPYAKNQTNTAPETPEITSTAPTPGIPNNNYKFAQIQQRQGMDQPNPSFTDWQQADFDTRDRQAGLPLGPTVDAANQQAVSDRQKFAQAVTGNVPTNTGQPTNQEMKLMKDLHGSFNPKSPGDLQKLDILRQAQQFAGPNATPSQIRNQAYALQGSNKTKASSALPGASQKPVAKGPEPTATKPVTTPQNSVPNSKLPGVLGSISNAVGRAGDTVQNIAQGKAGTGAQPRPTSTQTSQTQPQQAKQRPRFTYQKAGR